MPESSRDATRLVIAASATGAAVAVVVGELLRRFLPAPLSASEPHPHQHGQSATSIKRQSSSSVLRRTSFSDEEVAIPKHTDDSALRSTNIFLMERGRTANARAVGEMYSPEKTKIVRIALTGGPCAGKSSALEHLIESATNEGFDVLTAPEVATLYFNSSYQFPSPLSTTFVEQKFQFQANILKMQLQMERCYIDLASSTGRPTIIVFDRGLRDCLAFMNEEEWQRALSILNKELPNGPEGRITEEYTCQRYDGVIHLVTAADGAEEYYKFGIVEDDSGNKVYRRETPSEAIEQDHKLRQAWSSHPKHVVVSNGHPGGFEGKIEEATEAVLAIAKLAHPDEVRRAREIRNTKRSQSNDSAQ